MNKFKINNSGFSLIELVFAIVILSIGLTAFITLIINTTKNSIDPQIRQQGNAIAQAYLEEIMLNSFCEPDFDPDGDGLTECSSTTAGEGCTESACATGSTNTCGGQFAIGGAEVGRAVFDDVCDYNGLNDVGAEDQNGNPIGTLADYTVNVTVNDAGINLNGINSNVGQVVLVNVDVTHSTGATMSLSSYKTNF
jgi:MSHA pilin protein MshD